MSDKFLLKTSAALLVLTAWPGASFAGLAAADIAVTQQGGHDGGQPGGHDDGTHDDHDDDDHGDSDHGDSDHGGGGNRGYRGGREPGAVTPGHDRSIEDRVFRTDHGGYGRGGSGGHDSGGDDSEDHGSSDHGSSDHGSSGRGDLYGDMYVILRDPFGIPILNDAGFVQPVDASGQPIPLDDEGHPLDESLVVEVELGRLNVARAPDQVLDRRLEEVAGTINSATAVSLDPAGRLLLTVDGEQRTIDSPLENLAIYRSLMNTGSIPGVTLDAALLGDLAHLADGRLTEDDYGAAAGFLAGAADKTAPIGIDDVVYINAMLGIDGSIEGPDGRSYVDYGSFGYDRSTVHGGTVTTVLVQGPDGSWTTQTVDIFSDVFAGQNASGTAGLAAWVQAADDARAIINFLHEYEEPTHDAHD